MKTIIIDGIEYQLTPVNKPKSKKQEMKDFLKPFLTNLTIKQNNVKSPYSVYYEKNGEVLFELCVMEDGKRNFYVEYFKIWEVFYSKYGLTYGETQSFIKKIVMKKFKLGDVTPKTSLTMSYRWKTLSNFN